MIILEKMLGNFPCLAVFNPILLQAACGLTDKPKVQIVDIDAADTENELAVVEYVEDIYKFYKLVEVFSLSL